MSFQAYLDTIQRNTGTSAADFRNLAEDRGFTTGGVITPGVKATQITDWLKAEHGLGHGHAMALHALFKGLKREGDA